jgi:hypothetical protein
VRDHPEILRILRLQDGGLIEIYIDDVGVYEWRSVITELAKVASSVAYRIDDVESTFHGVEPQMFDPGEFGRHAVAFRIGEQTWTTGLFSPTEVDLQGDPREVQEEGDIVAVVALMTRLREITGRTVCLYAEGGHDMVRSDPIWCTPETLRVLQTNQDTERGQP